MSVQTESRVCSQSGEDISQRVVEVTPLRLQNFSRAVAFTSGVLERFRKEKGTLPEPIIPELEGHQLTKAWVWVQGGETLAQVGVCTSLDRENDSVFHIRAASQVKEAGKGEPLVWQREPLKMRVGLEEIDSQSERGEQIRRDLRGYLAEAIYDLEDAKLIIDHLRTHPPVPVSHK